MNVQAEKVSQVPPKSKPGPSEARKIGFRFEVESMAEF
jgi:hypothetical protein